MKMDLFVDILILFGAILLFLMSLGQLLLEKKDRKNYMLIACLVLTGIYQLSITFHLFSGLNNWYGIFPYVYVAGMFSIYCAIVMTYIFIMALPESNVIFTRKMLLHFIIPVTALIVLMFFADFPEDPGGSPGNYIHFLYHHIAVIRFVDRASIIMVLVYFSLIIINYTGMYRQSKKESKKNILAIIVLIIITFFTLLLYSSYYTGAEILNNIFKLRFTILAVYIFLISYRYPFVTNIIKLEAYRDYYMKSHVDNIEVDGILASLEQLMDEEKLFADGDLSVKTTADMLGITTHQLSEILNTRLHKTFSYYVKGKRIAYARELLVDRPELTILAVSNECGFNAISNFNTTFKKITGLSPTEYRKKHVKKKRG